MPSHVYWYDPNRQLMRHLLCTRLAQGLTPRQRVMCRLWAGTEHRYPMTMAEVGAIFGIPASRVFYQIRDARFQFGVFYDAG